MKIFISHKKFLLIIIFSVLPLNAQDQDNSKPLFFNGNINLTNNGFSFIPLFSLGKPATTVNISLGGKRLSFDSQLRFDLDGMRPWSFLFGWSYRLIQNKRFNIRLGSFFPAYAFSNIEYTRQSKKINVLTPQRYFIWNTFMSYKISNKINIGIYYLNGRGLEKVDQTKSGNFISFRIFANKLNLSKTISLNLNPEIYYLNIDNKDGFYVASTLSLNHFKTPFFISSTINKAINSNLNAKTFDWNIAINYRFGSSYEKIEKNNN